MRRLAILALTSVLLQAGTASAAGETGRFNPRSTGLPLGGGTASGPIAWCVIAQAQDDATPTVGVIGGCATDTGGNILETSSTNTGPLEITDLDSPIPGMIIYIVGTGGTDPSTISDGGNFSLEMDWTGLTDNVLELYVQADNDYIEVTRHNGPRYFDSSITVAGSIIGADADTIANASAGAWTFWGTGATSAEDLTYTFGATADQIDVASSTGATVVDWGSLNHALAALSLSGNMTLEGGGTIDTTSNGDITLAPNGSGVVDVQNAEVYVGDGAYSWDHAPMLATEGILEVDSAAHLESTANIGSTLTCESDIATTAAADWDVLDNTNDTLCIESPGGVGILCIDSRDGVEGVNMSGYLDVTGALSAGSLSVTGPLDMQDNDILNTVNFCREAPLSDLAPTDTVIIAEPNYAQGTRTAADIILAGGDDEMTITVDTTGGNEVGVIVTQTCKGVALAALTEGVEFACSGLSDSVCAANLAVAITAQSGTCVTTTSAAAVVYPQPIDCDAYATSFASTNGAGGGVAFVTSNGADGQVVVGLGGNAAPSIAPIGDSNTGFRFGGVNDLYLVTNGTARFYCNATSCYLGGSLNALGQFVYDSGQALRIGDATAPVTMLDVTKNTVFNGDIEVAGASYFKSTAALADDINIRFGLSADYWALYSTAATAFQFNSTDVDGIGTNGVVFWVEDGTPDVVFANNILLGPAMGTDAAPSDVSTLGPNSWAQASAGDARIGGDVWHGTGLGTFQIVCDRYADGALDRLLIDTVHAGVVDNADLVEGTHWTAATGDEETCDSVGAAILTYYGAGGLVVADCNTTGGTCYLQPKHDLFDIDISITNNAGDPFATLVEGADGIMVLPEFVAFGGTTSAFSGLQGDGVNLRARKGDNSGDTAFLATILIASGDVRTGSTGSFRFGTSRSRLTSSGDGYTNSTNKDANGFTRHCWGEETNQFACIYVDGAAGATIAGGSAITDVIALTLTGALSVEGATTLGDGADIVTLDAGTSAFALNADSFQVDLDSVTTTDNININRNVAAGTAPLMTLTLDHADDAVSVLSIVTNADDTADNPAVKIDATDAGFDQAALEITAGKQGVFLTGDFETAIKVEGGEWRRGLMIKQTLDSRPPQASDDSMWGVQSTLTHQIDANDAHVIGVASSILKDSGDAFQVLSYEGSSVVTSTVNRVAGFASQTLVTQQPDCTGADCWPHTNGGLIYVGGYIFQHENNAIAGEAGLAIQGDWDYGIHLEYGTFTGADFLLQNGETISNAVDGTIDLAGDVTVSGTFNASASGWILDADGDATLVEDADDQMRASMPNTGGTSYWMLDTTGTNENSPTHFLAGDNAGNQVRTGFRTAYGAQPYGVMSCSDDGTSPVDVDVIHWDDTSFRPASAGAMGLGSVANYFGNVITEYVSVMDSGTDHYAQIYIDEDLNGNYSLGFTLNNANRDITLAGNLSVEATSTVNQDLTTDATPTFAGAAFDDGDISNVGGIELDSISPDGTTVDISGVNILQLTQEDVGATCTLGQVRLDTGGATVEFCYCSATDTWLCTAMTAGPTD